MAEPVCRADANGWFTPSSAPANDTESLFIALVVLDCGVSARDAQDWANQAFAALQPLGGAALPDSPEWRINGKPGAMLQLPERALCGRSWRGGDLDPIGAAMQAWRSTGRHDGLQHTHLVRYFQGARRFPRSPKLKGGKHDGPPRWRSAPVLLSVAELIRRHGAELRCLLKLDTPIEEVPTLRPEKSFSGTR